MIRRRLTRRRGWLFLLWVGAVVSVAMLLNSDRFHLIDDAHLLFGVGIIVGISVIYMFMETEVWTIRRLGVFGLILFDALLYGFTGSINIWEWRTLTQHDLNWIRAVIIASAPLLLFTQIEHTAWNLREWWRRRRIRRLQSTRPSRIVRINSWRARNPRVVYSIVLVVLIMAVIVLIEVAS